MRLNQVWYCIHLLCLVYLRRAPYIFTVGLRKDLQPLIFGAAWIGCGCGETNIGSKAPNCPKYCGSATDCRLLASAANSKVGLID